MASNLPENLVGDMMSNAPRFTLPNFGAQNRPAPRPAAPAPQEPVQDGVAASPVSPASVRKPKPATAPAASKVSSGSKKEGSPSRRRRSRLKSLRGAFSSSN